MRVNHPFCSEEVSRARMPSLPGVLQEAEAPPVVPQPWVLGALWGVDWACAQLMAAEHTAPFLVTLL